MLVSQAALLLQLQVVFEVTLKVTLPPVAGMLRVVSLRVRVASTGREVWIR